MSSPGGVEIPPGEIGWPWLCRAVAERWAASIAEKFGCTRTGHPIAVSGTCRDRAA